VTIFGVEARPQKGVDNPLLGLSRYGSVIPERDGEGAVPRSVFTDKYKRFRELVIDARKQARLTQAELAQKLGKPQSFVSKYELGERRLDVVEFLEIALALGVKPEVLIKRLSGNAAKGGSEQ
jgi:ribosome-binding protein aMBF1 (putative translation factor)